MTSISSLNTLSAKTGIGGLMSGMDIDELVKNLTTSSRNKIFKQQQAVQKLQWKQLAYRTVTKSLTEFQSSYLDLLSATNFRSASFFNTVRADVSHPSVVSAVSAQAARGGTITIDYITHLAENQKISSTAAVSKPLTGSVSGEVHEVLSSEDISSLLSAIKGKSISLTLDGKLRTVTFDDSFIQDAGSDLSEEGLADALQSAVDKAFGVINYGDRMITVSLENGQLTFNTDNSSLSVNAVGSDTKTLSLFGLSDKQSNKISLYTPLESVSLAADLDPDAETFSFSINSVKFEFSRDKALADIIREIESSKAGVTIHYSSLTDSFTLTAKEAGAGGNIKIEETGGNLLGALGLTQDCGALVTYGKNAVLSVNGKEITRSSNNILVDGVNIELLKTTENLSEPVVISLKEDASSLLEPIKKFLEDYNALLDLMNGLVSEKPDSKYQPLSEEQKSEMTEKQIERWEENAKAGILRSDPVLRGLLSDLRTAMRSSAKSGGINLFGLGISTGGYQDYGKLKITDESKLIEALKTRGAEVQELFTTPETGLANRINDIIQGAVKRTGVKNTRGTLIELAGIEASSSDFENSISDTIKNTNKRIESLQLMLTAEESRLWRKFTAMEMALQRLDAQNSILMQFAGND